MKTIDKAKKARVAGVDEICKLFDLKRDAYYKYQKRQVQQPY
jgi:ACT domain-containing protein